MLDNNSDIDEFGISAEDEALFWSLTSKVGDDSASSSRLPPKHFTSPSRPNPDAIIFSAALACRPALPQPESDEPSRILSPKSNYPLPRFATNPLF